MLSPQKRSEIMRRNATTHGHAAPGRQSPTYRSWKSMHERCANPAIRGFARYGGRGIRVCERWKSFENFLADMGERPSSAYSLDRIDSEGNYEPSNCRWATALEQHRNRGNTIRVLFRGEITPLGQVCEIVGAEYSLTRLRLKRGWPIERALSEPRRKTWSRQRDARIYDAASTFLPEGA